MPRVSAPGFRFAPISRPVSFGLQGSLFGYFDLHILLGRASVQYSSSVWPLGPVLSCTFFSRPPSLPAWLELGFLGALLLDSAFRSVVVKLIDCAARRKLDLR